MQQVEQELTVILWHSAVAEYSQFVRVSHSDEEKGPLFEKRKNEDCTDSRPPESRIRTL